jgi:exodeoxyribonuclease-5
VAEEQKTPSFLLRQKFPFEPTVGQVELFQKMEKFILNTDDFGHCVFC